MNEMMTLLLSILVELMEMSPIIIQIAIDKSSECAVNKIIFERQVNI